VRDSSSERDARVDQPPTNVYGEVRPREAIVDADGHLATALEHVDAAKELADERHEPRVRADLHIDTLHLEELVDQRITSWQPNAPAEFVDETIEALWSLFYDYDLDAEIRFHLRSALQHLTVLQRCPSCGRPIQAEILVRSIGTGGPHALRGDPCVERYTPTNGWLLYTHVDDGGRSR
jgi:hypothetical protein